jgi:hypothetical protein
MRGRKIDEEAMKALRRGWYLGNQDFSQRLMALVEKKVRKGSRANRAHELHGKVEVERLAVETLVALGVSRERKDLEGMRKGDRAKVLVAALLRKNGSDKRLDCGTIEYGTPCAGELPCGCRQQGCHA